METKRKSSYVPAKTSCVMSRKSSFTTLWPRTTPKWSCWKSVRTESMTMSWGCISIHLQQPFSASEETYYIILYTGKNFFFLFWKVKSKKFNLTEQTKLIWDEIYFGPNLFCYFYGSLREFHNFIIIRPNPKCVRPEQTSTERTPTLTVAQNSGESGVFTSKSQQLSN